MLWAVSGLILTVISTFIQPAILIPQLSGTVVIQPIDTTLQVGAVLFTACMGGRNAAIVSQTAYVLLGLGGLNVFHQGGGFGYVRSPAFGYLVGFILGGAVCGHLAMSRSPSVENLTLSCVVGLLAIHAVGGLLILVRSFPDFPLILHHLHQYSLYPLGGQLLVVVTVAFTATVLRLLLFY
jgi:biotin transport system substrate-specific component